MLVSVSAENSASFAWRLYQEKDFRSSRREALREWHAAPERFDLQYLAEITRLRLNPAEIDAANELRRLAFSAPDEELSAPAALEAAVVFYEHDLRELAFDCLVFAFKHASDQQLLKRTAAVMFDFMRVNQHYAENNPGLLLQLQSLRAVLPEFERGGGVISAGHKSSRGLLARWVVDFYRSCIGPAIGQRCVMYPSCSHYFEQAGRAHGWLCVPLIADRLVREPGVASRAERPIEVNGMIRYTDLVEDHTFWLHTEQSDRAAQFGRNINDVNFIKELKRE